MTLVAYNAAENSLDAGFPIELYTFIGNGGIWYYTSADEDKIFGGIVFNSYRMRRSKIESQPDSARNPITIDCDKDLPFIFQFRAYPPTSVFTVGIQRYHEGSNSVAVIWVGSVSNVKFMERTASIRCEPIYNSLKRPVLRRMYQRPCPHVLYGVQCGVNRNSFASSGVVSTINGIYLTSSVFTNRDHYAGGYVDWHVTGGAIRRRFITACSGNQAILDLPFEAIAPGDSITAYPGCDHTSDMCHVKFNNIENFGGQSFYPDKNPQNGTPIF